MNPEEVGLSSATMAGLKPALQNLVDERKISGGIAMTVRHGKVADVTVFGWRDPQAKAPTTEDTVFAIVSMTKPITCVAVHHLTAERIQRLVRRVFELRDVAGIRYHSNHVDIQRARIAAQTLITSMDVSRAWIVRYAEIFRSPES